jgi:ferredoxin
MKGRPDERDTIFSRMGLDPSSARYREYYHRHPEREAVDRPLRTAGPGTFSDRTLEIGFIDSVFALIASWRPGVCGPVAKECIPLTPEKADRAVRTAAEGLGAMLTGIAPVDEAWVYGVRGRGERYGRRVEKIPPFVVVTAVEMAEAEVMTAPAPRQSIAVVKAYLEAAKIALALAGYIRSLGYEAVAHIDGESELVLPPAAAAAGLGEIGRHGLLVNRRFGSRLRFSAVTTTLPLPVDIPEEAVNGGLTAFCSRCGRCAALCPANAIPHDPPASGTPRPFGHTDTDACYDAWKKFGTDCGVCLAACPLGRKAAATEGGPNLLKGLMYRG